MAYEKERSPRSSEKEQGERFAVACGLLALDGNAQTKEAVVATYAGVASLMGCALGNPDNILTHLCYRE